MLPDLNPHRKDSAYDYIRDHFFGCEWHGAYSLLEFIVQNWPYDAGLHGSKLLNKVLIEERCGYTFIKKEIVPVSDEVEIKAIESALNAKVPSVREHMAKALALLSNFKKPDPENSIKESICAVEALAHKITGDKNGTLGQMVKKINGLHPSFVGALSQLYGFRNDGAGISHGSTKESLTDITLADAKFFLILCSGLVNYITAKESEGKVMKK